MFNSNFHVKIGPNLTGYSTYRHGYKHGERVERRQHEAISPKMYEPPAKNLTFRQSELLPKKKLKLFSQLESGSIAEFRNADLIESPPQMMLQTMQSPDKMIVFNNAEASFFEREDGASPDLNVQTIIKEKDAFDTTFYDNESLTNLETNAYRTSCEKFIKTAHC